MEEEVMKNENKVSATQDLILNSDIITILAPLDVRYITLPYFAQVIKLKLKGHSKVFTIGSASSILCLTSRISASEMERSQETGMRSVKLSPARAQKKRRHFNTRLQHVHKLNKMHEQQHTRTARLRFELDSEDEDAGPFPPLRFATAPPKLMTSKSVGQKVKAPLSRRMHSQQQLSKSTNGTRAKQPSIQTQAPERRAEPAETRLSRRSRHLGATAEQTTSFKSLSSVLSYTDEAVATALEQGLLSSTTFSSSAGLTDNMLMAMALKAKKQVEAVAKRQVMVGRWKRMPRSKPECQMFESISKAKDQYSVVAKVNLPCSLREIMSVFSTENATEFHRSMEAIFGDQYVYGVNVRSVDCAADFGEGSAQTCRASEIAASEGVTPSLRSTRLKMNAVSLMQKQRLVWKQRNMTFLDYIEEKIETKSVTRVMQTMDMADEELEFGSAAKSSPTAASSSQESCYHHNDHDIDPQYELKGILAGYVLQEDSEERFTRFFFYATHHHHPPGAHGLTRMPKSAVQLVRAMVNKVCLLETVVLRRRLGYYPLSRLPTSSDEATMASYCATCFIPFSILRKRHLCRLCGHNTCRKCSDVQAVEKTIGFVEKHRVCVSCVRRVSYCVFNMCAFPPKVEINVTGNSWQSSLSQQPTEITEYEDDYDPPILDDFSVKDSEDNKVVPPSMSGGGVFAGFVSDLLHLKEKKQEPAVDCRRRLQLTIDDLSTWVPGPLLDGHNTPKESISLLDSFCTSHSSASSRDPPSWLSPSSTGA